MISMWEGSSGEDLDNVSTRILKEMEREEERIKKQEEEGKEEKVVKVK